MYIQCYIKEGDQICVEICGKIICDPETVKDYGALCEKCNKGDRKSCQEMMTRFGCWSTTGWWL